MVACVVRRCHFLVLLAWYILTIGYQLPQAFPHGLVVLISIHMVHFIFEGLLINDLIYSELEGIIEHPGDKFTQQVTRTFNAWVFIDFNQPHLLIITDEIVQPEQLKAVFPLVEVNFFLH
jgi:hypothetical protein